MKKGYKNQFFIFKIYKVLYFYFLILKMNFSDIRSKLRENEETSRHGMKWFSEEDEKLIQEVLDKKTFEEIALEHKRTVSSIKLRIISNIIYPKYKNDNITIDDLSIEYNIDKELLEKNIKKIETPKEVKKSNEKNKNEDESKIKEEILYSKLSTLEDRMIKIEKKLNYIISYIDNS